MPAGDTVLAGLEELVFAADDELLAGLRAGQRATPAALPRRIPPPAESDGGPRRA